MKPHEQMEFELAFESIKKLMPMMLGTYPTIAKLSKVYYDELIKEGFPEDQALYIVAEQGIKARLD
ncbi:hypothetical protein [Paenibacillus larvae]|uniref:hypothetical protein n=1 Tax=Paenibacillus larvae TaxID=1464 RepID=UPI00288E2BE2|nr:hypothetical protein [Paenibacillus larvae]MDT2173271.1 hypothetical protein [Paenibacillus larvae]MDT2259615.1 hypothetical protein [Paenibacillus larvae]MDT2275127.1 hypothetical protein [Paenibacillus larvae]